MNNEELKHLILKNELFQEIEKLKAQLYSKDQIKATCPNCGEEFIINQCRVVTNLQGKQKEIMEYLVDLRETAKYHNYSEKEIIVDNIIYHIKKYILKGE